MIEYSCDCYKEKRSVTGWITSVQTASENVGTIFVMFGLGPSSELTPESELCHENIWHGIYT